MRSLLLTAGLVLAMAVPAQAQISFSPVVGYDLEADGPSIGLAFEVGGPLQSIPLAPSIRPLIEYVFIDAPTGADFTFIRGNVDLIGRLALGAQSQFAPYAKAGVSIEYFDSGVDVQGTDGSDTDVALNIGAGAEISNFFGEAELGLGGLDGIRLRVGYRF